MFATFIDTPLPPDWLGRAPPVLDDQASARVAVENDAAVRTVQELVFPRHGIEVPVD
jgi:hypothetical protein